MYRALIAFCSGLYIGSYYNCKPVIEHFIEKIKEHFPEKNKLYYTPIIMVKWR